MVGLFLTLSGCHAKGKSVGINKTDRFAQEGVANKLAAVGAEAITTDCEHESYTNASKGLVVEETGLHEDVFSLRDRDSLTANAYNLDEALRLEEILRAEAKVSAHSAAQDNCIDGFVQNFAVLTDALVQADKVQKELDMSAFKEANKEAQAEDQMEKQ
jgi:hypothetical protein